MATRDARESGESYWTLRARLNDVVRTMGLEAEEAVEEDALAERRRVLLQVQQGKLAAAEAATVLAALSADNE